MVDRAAFDRIIEAGGYITAQTGGAPDANLIPIPKPVADAAMDAAECIGCGACVAACPNGAANLFTAAKIAHLNLLPQGQAERYSAGRGDGRDDGRVLRLVHQPRRVRGRLPEVDLDRLHRADEQGLPARRSSRTARSSAARRFGRRHCNSQTRILTTHRWTRYGPYAPNSVPAVGATQLVSGRWC